MREWVDFDVENGGSPMRGFVGGSAPIDAAAALVLSFKGETKLNAITLSFSKHVRTWTPVATSRTHVGAPGATVEI